MAYLHLELEKPEVASGEQAAGKHNVWFDLDGVICPDDPEHRSGELAGLGERHARNELLVPAVVVKRDVRVTDFALDLLCVMRVQERGRRVGQVGCW